MPYGLKDGKNRWKDSSARGNVMEDLRSTTEVPAESQMWIDDNFQCVLKKLVHSFIDAENQLFALQESIKRRLESFKSDGKLPNGLKISNAAANLETPNVFSKHLMAYLERWNQNF